MNLNIAIAIVGTVLAAISAFKSVRDTKNISYNGLIFALGLAVIIASIHKYNKDDISERNAIKSAIALNHFRDSVADFRIKESNREILNGIGTAVGKYSLGYDSAKKELVALQKLITDSANKKTTIIQGSKPLLAFDDKVGMEILYNRNDTLCFNVHIKSLGAPSIISNGKVYIIFSTSEGAISLPKDLFFVSKNDYLYPKMPLDLNQSKGQTFYLVGSNVKDMKSLIAYAIVNYTDSYGRYPSVMSSAVNISVTTKKGGEVIKQYQDNIRDFLIEQRAL